MMRTGYRSGYWVVQWADGFDPNLSDLMDHLPEIVRGHRVAVASCDSGSFEPTPVEYAKGWTKRNEVAVSPKVDLVSELPMPGFDEWYVYTDEPPGERHRSFVNRWGFSPWDESNEEAQVFWTQLEQLRPLHVIGAGTTMFLATQDETIFRKASSTYQLDSKG